MKIKIGTVVKLKTGSPNMVVADIQGNIVVTEWFSGHELHRAVFHIQTIDEVRLPTTTPIAAPNKKVIKKQAK